MYSVTIAPQLKPKFTPLDLIAANGYLGFNGNYSQFNESKPGLFFKVKGEDYELQAGVTPTHFYIAE